MTDRQIEKSAFLRDLAPVSIELTRCRRSDPFLFATYTRSPLPPLGELCRLFPFTGLARWNLTVSHRARRVLIERANRPCRQKEHVFVPKDPRYPNSQDLYLSVGEPLVACKTARGS